MPLGFVIVYYRVFLSAHEIKFVWISTDLGPHVLKLTRDEATLSVECARVRSVFVRVDRRKVDAQKRVRNVADSESERE